LALLPLMWLLYWVPVSQPPGEDVMSAGSETSVCWS
jgi:hypothetical protein